LVPISNITKFVDEGYQWVLHECTPYDQIYKSHNTLHYQVFDVSIPYVKEFAEKSFTKYVISVIKQMPGMSIPLHKDSYYFFKTKHQLEQDEKVLRVNVFLDDWRPGHYFEAEGKPYVNWKRGEYVVLDREVEHRSGNMGDVPKYTAQVTGVF
jgi:hypothetical protein